MTALPGPLGTVAGQTVRVMALVAAIVAAVTTVQQWLYWPMVDRPIPLLVVAGSTVPSSFFWAAVTPLVIRLARRWPIRRPGLLASVPVHVAMLAALMLPYLLLVALPLWAWDRAEFGRFAFAPFFATAAVSSRAVLGAASYFGAIAVFRGLETARTLETDRARAAQLEAELARAQLRALHMQLHPHFLFNTLQAIRTLVDDDPAAARRTVVLLGDLLRLTLSEADRPFVPLRRELDFLNGYLEIERIRLGPRLAVTIDVPPDLLDRPLPSFLLQPLVENAIKHGIAHRRDPGRVTLRARRVDEAVEFTIHNDGPPLARNPRRDGIGLQTTETRLTRIYGPAASLALADDPSGGVRATLRIPVDP